MTRIAFAIADIGVCASTIAAARIAITCGAVRNVSVMAVAEHLPQVREELTALPGVAFGLHAAICCEWSHPRLGPVLGRQRVPQLCDPDGAFGADAVALDGRGVPLVEPILSELTAQLRCLREHRIPVTFLDEHMAFSWIPGVAGALEDLRRREGLQPIRPLQRLPEPAVPQSTPATRLLSQLAGFPEGTYLVDGHPSLPDEAMRRFRLRSHPDRDVATGRLLELELFTDPRVIELVRSRRIESVRFDEP